MTTPLNLLDDNEQKALWQQEDSARSQRYQKQQQQDAIVPDAASLDSSGLYNRLDIIRNNSAAAANGSIASANTRKQYEAALRAQKLEQARQKALDEAYKKMQAIAGGAGFGQPGSMTVYPGGQGGGAGWGSGGAQGVANVLRQAGFPESAVPTMMAIAMAESSWNPNATHSNSNGSVDNGLFQINTIHRGNSWYPSNPMDPLQSAIAAFNIWKGAGGTYRDWTVYNSGAYRQYLPSSVPPIQPYVANTGNGLAYAQVGQAQQYGGVPAYNGGNYGPPNYSGLAGNASAARDFVMRTFGISNIGGFGGGSVSGSDHPKGKAIDVMIPNYSSSGGIQQGTNIAQWFINNPASFGTKYVIWRDRIWENGSWSPYSHPSGNNDTLQHRDHVHISFR